MSLAHNTSTCRRANFAKNKKKRENFKGNLFILELCATRFYLSPPPPPPFVAKYLPHFVIGYVNNIKRFLDLFNCQNSVKFVIQCEIFTSIQLNLNSIQK